MFKINILKYQGRSQQKFNSIKDIPYYKLLSVEAIVEIYIDNILFFADDYFPILEFLYQFEKWKDERNSSIFEFNSMESEVNPIISFENKNGICKFDSIWKLTSEKLSADFSEVLDEITRCKEFYNF